MLYPTRLHIFLPNIIYLSAANTMSLDLIVKKLSALSLPSSGTYERCVFRYIEHILGYGVNGIKAVYPQTLAWRVNIYDIIDALVSMGELDNPTAPPLEDPAVSVCGCSSCKNGKLYDKVLGEDTTRFVDQFAETNLFNCYHCGLVCVKSVGLAQHIVGCSVRSYDFSSAYPGKAPQLEYDVDAKSRGAYYSYAQGSFGFDLYSAGVVSDSNVLNAINLVEKMFTATQYGLYGLPQLVSFYNTLSSDFETVLRNTLTAVGISAKRACCGYSSNDGTWLDTVASTVRSLPGVVLPSVLPGNWTNPYKTSVSSLDDKKDFADARESAGVKEQEDNIQSPLNETLKFPEYRQGMQNAIMSSRDMHEKRMELERIAGESRKRALESLSSAGIENIPGHLLDHHANSVRPGIPGVAGSRLSAGPIGRRTMTMDRPREFAANDMVAGLDTGALAGTPQHSKYRQTLARPYK